MREVECVSLFETTVRRDIRRNKIELEYFCHHFHRRFRRLLQRWRETMVSYLLTEKCWKMHSPQGHSRRNQRWICGVIRNNEIDAARPFGSETGHSWPLSIFMEVQSIRFYCSVRVYNSILYILLRALSTGGHFYSLVYLFRIVNLVPPTLGLLRGSFPSSPDPPHWKNGQP
jgi:hypothetical protein